MAAGCVPCGACDRPRAASQAPLSGCLPCLQPQEAGEVVGGVGERELRGGAGLADGADHRNGPIATAALFP